MADRTNDYSMLKEANEKLHAAYARITELESALMAREDKQTQGAVNAVNGVYQQASMDGNLRAPDFIPDAPSDRLMRIEARLDALEDRLA